MEFDPNVFDANSEFYGRIEPSSHDYYFLKFIERTMNAKVSLLDVGGGSGIFSSLVKNTYPCIEITMIEPSYVLLNKIPNIGIKKIEGSLPNGLNIDSDLRFDYIHLREVFHHLVGSTIKDSKDLTAKSLITLKNHLDDNGYLMIHELFYEGYIIPSYITFSDFLFIMLSKYNDNFGFL